MKDEIEKFKKIRREIEKLHKYEGLNHSFTWMIRTLSSNPSNK